MRGGGGGVSYESQEKFVSDILRHPAAVRTPPPVKYTCSVLRAYTDAVSGADVEDLSDTLFEILAEAQPRVQETKGFLSYDVPVVAGVEHDGDSLSNCPMVNLALAVEPQHNEVGLRMWEAGYLLTEYVLVNPSSVRGLRVVELGAGLGLTGIAASACSGAGHIVLTDCAMGVLENLEDGLELNAQAWPADRGCSVSVLELDWMQGGEEALTAAGGHVDVGLAADVLYDPTVVPHFVNVVEAFVRPPIDASSPRPVCFVAATLRNPATLALFFEEIRRRGIPCLECLFQWPESTGIPRPFHYEAGSVRLFALGGKPKDSGEWFPLGTGPLGRGV